ncbi:phage tail terminator protein [Vitreoscilla stercoraria]|uniref:Uncharacterized protein n=1 Tax=Vitreoscilla stercoraria TaxID=61 RepID=A0ABY4EE22_VITST|nr:hypothetical protein [Vitreoscilla stercoraria]UOO93583.1 hypothetical protein LVJ81_06040 [Vitreoscilla stercoraria]
MQMHDNMLAVYPTILERLATIEGVKAVKEAGELAVLMAGVREKRQMSPLHGAVYVIFGGHTPTDSASKGKNQVSELNFTFAYCSRYVEGGKSNLYEVGAVLTAIKKAFQGFDVPSLVVKPFTEVQAPPIEYNDGFALYPLSFVTSVATILN